jgi:hypothetical protein
MAAVNHRGKLVYVNTQLANALGHKLKFLRHKDITTIMPQPHGALHLKYLRVSHVQSQCQNMMVACGASRICGLHDELDSLMVAEAVCIMESDESGKGAVQRVPPTTIAKGALSVC